MLSNSKIQHAINNWDKYICHKPGSQLPAFYRQLHDAQDSNLKRSLKHTEQAKNPWISYLNNVIYPMTRSQPKEKNLRVRPSSLRKRKRSQRCQPQVQVKLLNLGMRPKSEMEISPNVPTIPLAKPIGHGNARAARHREMLPESKQDQKQHPLDASTALTIQGCRKTR